MRVRFVGAFSAIVTAAAFAAAADSANAPKQTHEAARTAYAQDCASCHGEGLGGRFAPPLTGSAFVERWGSQSVDTLAQYMQQTMPPASPDSLPQATYVALARFLRSENGLADEASDETAAEPSRPARDASASQATAPRSEEHTPELQSLMRISYAVFCLK